MILQNVSFTFNVLTRDGNEDFLITWFSKVQAFNKTVVDINNLTTAENYRTTADFLPGTVFDEDKARYILESFLLNTSKDIQHA